MNNCKYNDKHCVCIKCEKEYGINKEECSIHKCKNCEQDGIGGHGLGWCKKYWKMKRNPQMNLFKGE